MSPARDARRGLVLGGGGVLGAAWMVGALAALQKVHGFDPRDSEVITGTSVGSVIGSLLGAGISVDQMIDHQRGLPITTGPLAGYSFDYEKAAGGGRPQRPKMTRLGSAALLGASLRNAWHMPPTAILSGFMPAGTGSLVRVGHLIDAITPMDEWSPHPNLWVITMDYQDGRRVAFGKPGEVAAPLAQAVMASCAIPGWFAPVDIGGRQYVDGGTWSSTNLDLVAGQALDEVYVVAPLVSFHLDHPKALLTRLERRWRRQVTKRCLREAEEVRANGASVTILGPGPDDLKVMGGNVMDMPRRTEVLETSLHSSIQTLRDPENVGPDHVSELG
ncbi:MAG: patatin-like phospholipase family protein [Candidatus Nanopelagicales bacterium]|nr:patatin-like phospholipase family protein [Candidatus Nanopelagicales bacterium]MDZ4249944.1 patatin-like phospholipase family protein [Candidatus Nanopelagicales bacterium]